MVADDAARARGAAAAQAFELPDELAIDTESLTPRQTLSEMRAAATRG